MRPEPAVRGIAASAETSKLPLGAGERRGGGLADLERAVGRFVIRRYRWSIVLVLALMAANVFVGLGSTSISDSDEARYGVSAYEMLQNRSYVVTTYAHQPEYWNLKPPLGYWLIALSYWLFGFTTFALRLPSAICGLAVVAGTMAFAKRWGNRRLAVLSGLIVATAFGFVSNHGARSGDLDAALTFLLLLAAMQLPRLARSPRPVRRLLALAAILACAFLLKSFAILPMVAIAVVYAVGSGAWRRLRPAHYLLSGLLFAAVVAAWAFARYRADGSAYFLERMLREDLLLRSTRIIDKTTYSPFGYLAGLFDRFAPWPLAMLAATWVVLRGPSWRASALARRLHRGVLPLLVLWALVPLVLFSLSRTQHHWYLDPIYPACAMLAALSLLALLRAVPAGRPRTAALLGLVVLPLALCQARVTYRVLVGERMPPAQRFLLTLGTDLGVPRQGLGRDLVAGFPLQHSERFLLEVIDGFRVRDLADGAPTPGVSPADGEVVLDKRGAGAALWRSSRLASVSMAGDRSYSLARFFEPRMERPAAMAPPVQLARFVSAAALGRRAFASMVVPDRQRLGQRPEEIALARSAEPPPLLDAPHPGLARPAQPAPSTAVDSRRIEDEPPVETAAGAPEPHDWPGAGPLAGEEDDAPVLTVTSARPAAGSRFAREPAAPLDRLSSAGPLAAAAGLVDWDGPEDPWSAPLIPPPPPQPAVAWDDGPP